MAQYLILDAARMGTYLEEVKKLCSQIDSLYVTKKEEDMLQSVAPYLCNFSNSPKLQEFYYSNGWGDSWGIIIGSDYSFQDVYKHFRKFLMVKTEEGEELYFRFYDPRVLRIFLPTCDAAQLKELFAPIDYFLMEDEDKIFSVKFSLGFNGLKKEQIPFDSINKLTSTKQQTDYATINEINAPVKPTFNILEQQPTAPKTSIEMPTEIKKPKFNIFD